MIKKSGRFGAAFMLRGLFLSILLISLFSIFCGCAIDSGKKPGVSLKGEEYYGRYYKENNRIKDSDFNNEADEYLDIDFVDPHDSYDQYSAQSRVLSLDEEEMDKDKSNAQKHNSSLLRKNISTILQNEKNISTDNVVGLRSNDNVVLDQGIKRPYKKIKQSSGNHSIKSSDNLKKFEEASETNSGLDQEIIDLIKSIE